MAASLPMPRVYIIDDSAPNAFATGRDPAHASVAITTGLLEKLDREELQGVIAHELSHVRNFDIRFSLMVGVLVGLDRAPRRLLPALHVLARRGGAAGASRRTGRRRVQAVIMVVGDHPGDPRPDLRRLVQLAVSRQREYLADASAVELTRNPYGLERALAKIARDTELLEVANRATQHLYFVNPIKAADRPTSVAVLDAPADPRPDQPPARPHGPAAGGRCRPGAGPGCPGCAAAKPRLRVAPVRPVRLPPVRGTCYSPARRRAPAGTRDRAEIAQLVEHATENRGVASSNLALGTTPRSVIERKWLSW